MKNILEFLSTAFKLFSSNQMRVPSYLILVLGIASYYFPVATIFTLSIYGISMQYAHLEKIVWKRILEIFCLTLWSAVLLVALGVLTYLFFIKPNMENKVVEEAPLLMVWISNTLLYLLYPIIPLMLTLWSITRRVKKFEYFMPEGTNSIVINTVYVENESRWPYLFLSIMFFTLDYFKLPFVCAAPFVVTWIYMYVLDKRIQVDEKEEEFVGKRAFDH